MLSTWRGSRIGCASMSKASAGRSTVDQFGGGQSNPTYRLTAPSGRYVLRRKPPGKLLASAHAVDREYRVITALGTSGLPGAAQLRPLRGRERHRHRVLRHGLRRGPRAVEPAAPRPAESRAQRDLRCHEHGHGAAPSDRLRRDRPRELRPPRQLSAAPDRPLEQAVPPLRDRADRGDGQSHRVAAEEYSRGGRDQHRPWRLPHGQHDLPCDRAARPRDHRLGAVDARQPARRFRLSHDVLAARSRRRSAASPAPTSPPPESRARPTMSPLIAAAPGARRSRTGTPTSPTTCSASPRSSRAS